MPTEYGITYEVQEGDIGVTSDVVAAGENTTASMTVTFANGTSTTFNINKAQHGIDPDVFFADQLEDFEYFKRDYIENNPGTINNIITSYVGSFYSDTTEGQSTMETGTI